MSRIGRLFSFKSLSLRVHVSPLGPLLVHEHVLLELVRLEEALVAHVARVRPVVLVGAQVALVRGEQREGGATVAAVGPLSCVRAHVPVQAVRVAKAALADGAVVLLLSRVRRLVLLPTPRAAQDLAAEPARVHVCKREAVSPAFDGGKGGGEGGDNKDSSLLVLFI